MTAEYVNYHAGHVIFSLQKLPLTNSTIESNMGKY